VTVSHCDLSEAAGAALFVAAPQSRVHRNRLHHSGRTDWYTGAGLAVVGRGARITSNLVHENRDLGIAFGRDWLDPSAETTVIEGNVAWSNGVRARQQGDLPAGFGIGAGQTASPVVIRGNVSCGNAAAGYQLYDAANVLFDGNVSCFNPLAVAAEQAAFPVWVTHHASLEDGLTRALFDAVVGNSNRWHRGDGAVKFLSGDAPVTLEVVRATTGQEEKSSLEAPAFAGGLPAKYEPMALAGWDFCSPDTPLLCGRR
jgi:Right handed beta helix region